MFQKRISPIVILGLTLLISLGAQTVRAAQNKAEASSPVAVVDMDRLFQESDAPKQLAQKVTEIESAATQKVKDITAGAYLDQKKGPEYVKLLIKATQTPEEQTRIKQLRELSETRSKRLQELAQKNPLTDPEKNEMRDLTTRQRQMALILPRMQEGMQADVAAQIELVRRELFSKLRATVMQVAKDQGIARVFSSDVLIYSTNDLTPQVLQKLKGAGGPAGRADQNKAEAPPSMAVVDMHQIFDSSDAPKQLAQKTAQIEEAAMQRFNSITAGAFLTQQEGPEYLQLLAKAMPTPNEQARIKQLRELSETRSKRLQELVNKKELTDAEKNEMRDLTARQRNMEQILPRIQEDLQADVATRIEAVRRALFAQLRTTVAQVAKDKGVTQVFSADALIYATNDLTPQVLQKVKK